MTNWFSQTTTTTTTTNIIFILPPTLTLTVDSTNPNSSSVSGTLNIINNASSPTNQTTLGASDYMVEFTVQNVLLAFFLISLGLSTILGNTFVLLAIFVDFHLRSPTHYLMGSLALADLLLGTLVLPFSSTQLYFESWPFGERFCEIWLTTDVLCCTASIYLVLVISIDRYIGITRPLRYSTIMTKRRIYLIILFVWTLSLVVSLAPQIGWKSPQNSSKICEVNEDLAYALFSASLSFYIPLAIILIVYYRIFKEARAQSRFLKTGIKTSKASDGLSEVTLRVHIGPTTNQNQPSRSSGHHTGSHNRHQQHHHLHSSSHSTAAAGGAGGGAAASNARYSHSSMCICRTGSNSSMGGGYRASGGGGRRSGVSMVGMNARRCGYPMSLSRREMSEMSSKNFESYIDDDIIQKELPSSPVTVVAPAVGISSQHQSNGGPKSGIFSAKSSVKSVNIANAVGKSGSGGSGTGPKTGSNRNSNTNSAELCKYCSTSVNNLSGSTGVLANKFAKFKSEQKAAKTLAIVVGCFTLCWLPFFLILPIESLKLLPIPKIVFRVFFWLGYCNSAMNPLIYALSSREFRRAYKGILKCNLKYRSKKENKKYINYKFKTNFM